MILNLIKTFTKNNNFYGFIFRLHGVKDSLTKKRYITYPDTFKRLVVFYAETHSKIAAARVFNVARRRVLEWQELAGKNQSIETRSKFHLVRSLK